MEYEVKHCVKKTSGWIFNLSFNNNSTNGGTWCCNQAYYCPFGAYDNRTPIYSRRSNCWWVLYDVVNIRGRPCKKAWNGDFDFHCSGYYDGFLRNLWYTWSG